MLFLHFFHYNLFFSFEKLPLFIQSDLIKSIKSAIFWSELTSNKKNSNFFICFCLIYLRLCLLSFRSSTCLRVKSCRRRHHSKVGLGNALIANQSNLFTIVCSVPSPPYEVLLFLRFLVRSKQNHRPTRQKDDRNIDTINLAHSGQPPEVSRPKCLLRFSSTSSFFSIPLD